MKRLLKLSGFVVLATMFFATTLVLAGGDPDYQLSLTSASGGQDSCQQIHVNLDNMGGEITGWSIGVCHDPSLLIISSVEANSN